ncbi:MAG: glycosyl hydrolase family 79 C-terminal domain-containing protein [Solirubrobacteraceae bacterium]
MPHRIFRHRSSFVVWLAGALALAAAAITLVVFDHAPAVQATAGGATTVTVGRNAVGQPVPDGFLGVATDYWDIFNYVGTNPAAPDTVFEQVLRNLTPVGWLDIRFGGDSTDWTWWPVKGMKKPIWVRWTITRGWEAVTAKLAQALHAHLILGINMEADSTVIDKAEIHALATSVGRVAPVTFELGNEPELYATFPFYHTKSGKAVFGRPKSSWSYAAAGVQWRALASTLDAGKLAGPGYASLKAAPYVSQFLSGNHSLKMLTIHTYALKPQHCQQGGHLQEGWLFQPSALQDLADGLRRVVSVATAHGTQVRVDEMNAVTCGGLKNFSASFGPALWALNVLPLYEQAGVAGINFQTRPGTAQDLIEPTQTASGWQVQVQPEYYGLLAFAQLAPPGSRLLSVAPLTTAGLFAWAVRNPDHQLHVVVTNTTSNAHSVAVKLAGASGPANVQSLSAGSGGLAAKGGVKLGGGTIDPNTGALTGVQGATTVKPVDGAYKVTVAPDSAAILTADG